MDGVLAHASTGNCVQAGLVVNVSTIQARTPSLMAHRLPSRRGCMTGEMRMYDAIVVGARCAGSPTAMLLARHGYRVLLVDRTTFPSDTLSTHAITYRGLVKLQAWGLYDQIKATGCPEVIRRTIDLGDFPLTGEIQRANGLPGALCPRRTVLDKALVDAAVAAGVELREGYAVRDLVMDDGRVTGIRGAQKHGRVQTDRARIVIGFRRAWGEGGGHRRQSTSPRGLAHAACARRASQAPFSRSLEARSTGERLQQRARGAARVFGNRGRERPRKRCGGSGSAMAGPA